MRRILMVLAVAAMLAVMLTVIAGTAFAIPQRGINQKGINAYCDHAVEKGAKGQPPLVFCF